MSATKSLIARPAIEVLRRLYVEEGLGCPEIGARYERDGKTVHYWLRCAGIPTRPRGANPRVWFPKGHTRSFGRRKDAAEIAKIRDATIARGGVPYLRDGRHWLKGARPDANPNWKGGATPERQAFYRSPEWKAACVVVWHRADARCERCGLDHRTVDRRAGPRFHVHHIVSFVVKALRAEPTNLALLCRPCHLFVHSKANEAREFLLPPPTTKGD